MMGAERGEGYRSEEAAVEAPTASSTPDQAPMSREDALKALAPSTETLNLADPNLEGILEDEETKKLLRDAITAEPEVAQNPEKPASDAPEALADVWDTLDPELQEEVRVAERKPRDLRELALKFKSASAEEKPAIKAQIDALRADDDFKSFGEMLLTAKNAKEQADTIREFQQTKDLHDRYQAQSNEQIDIALAKRVSDAASEARELPTGLPETLPDIDINAQGQEAGKEIVVEAGVELDPDATGFVAPKEVGGAEIDEMAVDWRKAFRKDQGRKADTFILAHENDRFPAEAALESEVEEGSFSADDLVEQELQNRKAYAELVDVLKFYRPRAELPTYAEVKQDAERAIADMNRREFRIADDFEAESHETLVELADKFQAIAHTAESLRNIEAKIDARDAENRRAAG